LTGGCSALTQQGLKNTFDTALKAVLTVSGSSKGKKGKKSKDIIGINGKLKPMPPVMPRAGSAPWINIGMFILGSGYCHPIF